MCESEGRGGDDEEEEEGGSIKMKGGEGMKRGGEGETTTSPASSLERDNNEICTAITHLEFTDICCHRLDLVQFNLSRK